MRSTQFTLLACLLFCTVSSQAQGGFNLSSQDQKQDIKKTKGQPVAKTKEEFDAYQTAFALTDLAAKEKAVTDFAMKFPDSDTRTALWSSLMQDYFFKQGNAKKAT